MKQNEKNKNSLRKEACYQLDYKFVKKPSIVYDQVIKN